MDEGIHLTVHARDRAHDMDLSDHEIECALRYPEAVYPGVRGRTCYQRGRLVVVYDQLRRTVITFLWHRKEGRDGTATQESVHG